MQTRWPPLEIRLARSLPPSRPPSCTSAPAATSPPPVLSRPAPPRSCAWTGAVPTCWPKPSGGSRCFLRLLLLLPLLLLPLLLLLLLLPSRHLRPCLDRCGRREPRRARPGRPPSRSRLSCSSRAGSTAACSRRGRRRPRPPTSPPAHSCEPRPPLSSRRTRRWRG